MLADSGCIIFDMDGLLIDSEPLWWRAEHALAEAHGLRWSDELARSCLGTGLGNAVATMQARIGLAVEVQEGVAWLLQYFADHLESLQLKPGCRPLLAASKERRCAIASSSPLTLIKRVVQRFSIGEYFEELVAGEMVAQAKPAPDIFLDTCKRLGCKPADSVVLEDSLAGCQAGVAAGAKVIAIPEFIEERNKYLAITPHVVASLFDAAPLLGLALQAPECEEP
jgi:HAD superfamily hydrolase (TIGR01509 family)